MSDYLGHLAARSLDPERAAVRPRLASRFEPVAPWAPPVWPENREAATAPLETTAEGTAEPRGPARGFLSPNPRMESPEPVGEQPAPARSRRPRAMKEEESELTPEPSRREPPVRPLLLPEPPQPPAAEPALAPVQTRQTRRRAVVEELEASPEPRRREQPAHPLSLPEPSRPRTAALVPAYTPIAPPPDRRIEAVPVHPAIVPAKRETPLPLSPPRAGRAEPERVARPAERPSSSAEPRPASPAALVPKPAPPARIVVEPRVALAPLMPPAVPAPIRSTEVPAPTIQVTIGRIEVRATPPPAQPSRPRPPAPSAVSLEEYLRRRSKGGDG